jgi:hypothetical protein
MARGPDVNNPENGTEAEIEPKMTRTEQTGREALLGCGQLSNKRYSSVNAV